jgi:cytochrome c-type biogenesis protein CcmH/NrfF
MDRGDSDSLVLQSFVQKYGNTVLSAPTSSGFNVVAWIMPFAVFAAASVLTVVAVYSAIGIRDEQLTGEIGKAMMSGPAVLSTT